jgi:predicted MFS family arabinose efflux permease
MITDTGPDTAPVKKAWVASYVAVVFAMMTMQMSSLGFSPLIPAMKADWNMSYTQVGTFTGVYGLVALIMSVPAGLLIKRSGEKRVLSVGLTLAALGLVLVSLAGNYLEVSAAAPSGFSAIAWPLSR